MGELQRRNYKFERRKPPILMLALSREDRHSRPSLSLTNPMKTPVLSLITALTIAAFLGCQTQKKEEAATTTHAASTSAKKTSTTKKTSASAEASPSASPKKTTKKKAAAEESASPTASPSATP